VEDDSRDTEVLRNTALRNTALRNIVSNYHARLRIYR
jgi:hypothetical protein